MARIVFTLWPFRLGLLPTAIQCSYFLALIFLFTVSGANRHLFHCRPSPSTKTATLVSPPSLWAPSDKMWPFKSRSSGTNSFPFLKIHSCSYIQSGHSATQIFFDNPRLACSRMFSWYHENTHILICHWCHCFLAGMFSWCHDVAHNIVIGGVIGGRHCYVTSLVFVGRFRDVTKTVIGSMQPASYCDVTISEIFWFSSNSCFCDPTITLTMSRSSRTHSNSSFFLFLWRHEIIHLIIRTFLWHHDNASIYPQPHVFVTSR